MRRFLVPAGLTALSLLCAAPVVERCLEASERARLDENETFVQLGSARVRYRLAGADRSAPAVVLLNGFVAPMEQWLELEERIATFAPVLAYDRGGLGLSEGSDAHDAQSQADELSRVLTALQVKTPIVLVSYSASSMVARVFTRDHPALVGGLVFIDPDNPEQIADPDYVRRYRVSRVVRLMPFDSTFDYMTFRSWVDSSMGITRIQAWWRHDSESATRLRQVYALSSHWRAAYREARVRKASAAESLHWLAGDRTDLPLGVVSSGKDGDDAYRQDMLALHQKLAASSSRGVLRNVPDWGHDEILDDPSHLPVLEEMIEAIANMVRP